MLLKFVHASVPQVTFTQVHLCQPFYSATHIVDTLINGRLVARLDPASPSHAISFQQH